MLQPTYEVHGGRAVVHLWGTLEDGRSFLVRDRRAVPRFYVAASDGERARELSGRSPIATELRTLGGEPALRIELARPSDTPALRDRLQAAGVRC